MLLKYIPRIMILIVFFHSMIFIIVPGELFNNLSLYRLCFGISHLRDLYLTQDHMLFLEILYSSFILFVWLNLILTYGAKDKILISIMKLLNYLLLKGKKLTFPGTKIHILEAEKVPFCRSLHHHNWCYSISCIYHGTQIKENSQ